jgi:hypothetical protein
MPPVRPLGNPAFKAEPAETTRGRLYKNVVNFNYD